MYVWICLSPKQLYLSCVSPAFTLILPTVSCGFVIWPPQGMMVCTRFHTFFHRTDPSQWNLSNISSPKSLSRVIRKVYVLLMEIFSGLVDGVKKADKKNKTVSLLQKEAFCNRLSYVLMRKQRHSFVMVYNYSKILLKIIFAWTGFPEALWYTEHEA